MLLELLPLMELVWRREEMLMNLPAKRRGKTNADAKIE